MIGLSTAFLPCKKWWKSIKEFNIPVIEVNRRFNQFPFDEYKLEDSLPVIKDFDLSLHSATYNVFNSDKVYTQIQLETLKAEIYMAKKIGAKQIIFHIHEEKYSNEQLERLGQIVDLGYDAGVQLLLENGSFNQAESFALLFDKIPNLKMNLDFGHLNKAMHNGLYASVKEVVELFGNKIEYCHMHNNYGKKDEHNAVDDGTLDYKEAIRLLKECGTKKFIIEAHTREGVLQSMKALKGLID